MKNQIKLNAILAFALMMLFAVSGLQAQEKTETPGIAYHHGTFKEALAKASAENKLVFVDAYAQWCGPCRWMAANVFPDPEVGKYFNEHFVFVKMDMERGEGRTLAREWGIRAYPTLIVFGDDGKEQTRKVGMLRKPEMLEFGKKVVASAASVQ